MVSYIDRVFQYNDTKDTATEKYLYNGSNQLVTHKEYDYSKATGAVLYNTTNYTYDAAGNVIKEAGMYDVNTYTYTTILNNFSMGFTPLPPAKYFLKTTTNVNGGVTVTINHSYTFDSSNRLTSEKQVTSDGDIGIKSYTY